MNSSNDNDNVDDGDNVVVINAERIHFTGNKLSDKKYYKHTGYPGGIKMQTPEDILSSKFPERILKKAVERMMPSGPLANKQLKNLKVYSGSDHPHGSRSFGGGPFFWGAGFMILHQIILWESIRRSLLDAWLRNLVH